VILPYSRKCKNFASGIDAIKCKACTLCLVCDIVGHNCAIGNVARAQAVQEGLPRPFIVSPVNYILPVGDAPALKARSLAAGARPLFCITTSSANQDSVVECCMSEQGSRNDYVRVQEWLRGRLRLLALRQRRMHRRRQTRMVLSAARLHVVHGRFELRARSSPPPRAASTAKAVSCV
jgi:hypothetical protein